MTINQPPTLRIRHLMQPEKILDFPKLIIVLVAQLVYYTLTEVETLLLVIFSILLGLQLGWLWGATIFFAAYWATRMVGGYVTVIASKVHLIAQIMSETTRSQNE